MDKTWAYADGDTVDFQEVGLDVHAPAQLSDLAVDGHATGADQDLTGSSTAQSSLGENLLEPLAPGVVGAHRSRTVVGRFGFGQHLEGLERLDRYGLPEVDDLGLVGVAAVVGELFGDVFVGHP